MRGDRKELFDWECCADVEPGLAALAYAYRNVTLIALYRLMRGRLKAGYIGYIDGQTSTSDAIELTHPGQDSSAGVGYHRIPGQHLNRLRARVGTPIPCLHGWRRSMG